MGTYGNSRKRILTAILALWILSLSGPAECQEKYPSRNIDLVIAMGPGSTTDLVGRMFADELSKAINVAVVPTNKPGATGTVAAAYVLKAKNDGYTVLMSTISGLVLSRYILPNVPFETTKDFTPVCRLAVSPCILLVKKDSPVKTLEDLIEHAKKNPGKLNYGSVGKGSDTHLVVEQLQEAAHIKLSQVPFDGGGEAITALLGGHIDVVSTLLPAAASHLRSGTVRGIVISGGKRMSAFQDIPTYSEKGLKQQFFTNWSGILAPAGTVSNAVNVLASACEKALKSTSFVGKAGELGTSLEYLGPQEFKKFIEEEDKIAKGLIEKIGLKPKK